MFAKLATVIVVLGAMFGALLVNRQERIDTAAEISRIHFELERNERERIRREADVAGLLTPAEIRTLVERIEKDATAREAAVLKPIPFREDPSSASDDALGTPEELRKLVKEPARGAEGFGG
ncbi:MAG: hypothetical protein LW806_00190 [Planctomycetaceae bacterium]|nr:hypothetical protein [Planctomycetaceae bacterium]